MTFIDWPVWQVVMTCFVLGALPPALLWWVIYHSPLTRFFQGGGVEPAMIGSVGLLFGLFAAFLANDIWLRNQIAQNAVVQEGDAIRTLARYAEGMSEQHNALMQAALVDYVETVVAKDWPKMREGGRSKELLAKVRHISGMLITGEIGRAAGPTIQGRMIDAYTDMRQNRQIRVQLAENRKLTIKWHALLIFGLLTQLAIAVVHVARPRAHLLAQAIFALAFSTCVAILITHEFPFSALNPVSAEPLVKAMESLSRK